MQILTTTDYAIRAILYLAMNKHMATAGEVAEKTKIPKQYLTTMARRLKDAGLIAAKGGQDGGYYLARPAESISVLDVVRVTENTMCISRCLERQKGDCCFQLGCCPVREVYAGLQSVIDQTLGSVTIAELVRRAQARP